MGDYDGVVIFATTINSISSSFLDLLCLLLVSNAIMFDPNNGNVYVTNFNSNQAP